MAYQIITEGEVTRVCANVTTSNGVVYYCEFTIEHDPTDTAANEDYIRNNFQPPNQEYDEDNNPIITIVSITETE